MTMDAASGIHETTSGFIKNCPKIPMRDGTLHPAIGFGTYKVGFVPASASSAVGQQQQQATAPEAVLSARECVANALNVGYRFLECAEFYGNEKEVGYAIESSRIPRSELFLCSKVWTTTIEKGPDAIRTQLEKTLRELQTNYLDLYLIHWPVPKHHVTAYKTLLQLRKEGWIRGVGVSNYAWEDYLELKEDPEISQDDLPLVNQIEINPFLYRKNTIAKFRQEGVVLQSYRSLRDGKVMNHPTLLEIASRYRHHAAGSSSSDGGGGGGDSVTATTTPAQILGRWCLQRGFVYTPKSVKMERMKENANVLDFELSEEDMQALDQLTTPENLQTFLQLYRKCVNRDTSKDGTLEGVKMDITLD